MAAVAGIGLGVWADRGGGHAASEGKLITHRSGAPPPATERSPKRAASDSLAPDAFGEPTKPVGLRDWISMIEPLDFEGSNRRLERWLSEADADELLRLCEEIDAQLSDPDAACGILIRAMGKHAAGVDFERFFAIALDEPKKVAGRMLFPMLQQVATRSFDQAERLFDRIESKNGRSELWRALGIAAGNDVGAAWARLNQVFDRRATEAERKAGLVERLGLDFGSYHASLNPDAFTTWLRQEFAESERRRSSVLAWWGNQASEYSGKKSPPVPSGKSIQELKSDYDRKSREGDSRQRKAESIAELWGQTDAAAAAQWVDSLPDAEARAAAQKLLPQWANHDPRAAAQWLANHPRLEISDGTALDLARALAALAPPEAIQFSHSLSADQRWKVLSLTALGWGRFDAAAATAAVLAEPSGDLNEKGLLAVAEGVLNDTPQAATQWVGTIPAGFQPAVTAKILKELTLTDPSAAARALGAYVASGGRVDTASVRSVAADWAAGAPDDAAAWADALAEGAAKEAATLGVAQEWAKFDADAATEWIAQMPEGTLKTSCRKALKIP